jgi:hypothetical protein
VGLGVQLEDAADDGGLDLVDDRDRARVLGIGRVLLADRPVPVDAAAGPEPRESAALEPAQRLAPDDLEHGVVHERERAELDASAGRVRRHPGAHVDDANVGGREVAEHDLPGVAEVAGEPREVVDEDRLEAASRGARLGEEPLQVGALEVGAALGRVLEHAGDVEPASLRECAAAAYLVVDGPRILPVRRVAGVDRDRGCVVAGGAGHRVRSFVLGWDGFARRRAYLRRRARRRARPGLPPTSLPDRAAERR